MFLIDVLEGASGGFYGADLANNRFRLGDLVVTVFPDPQDGYRSCLGSMAIHQLAHDDPQDAAWREGGNRYDRTLVENLLRDPVCIVSFRKGESVLDRCRGYDILLDRREVWELVDDSGHVWLTFGTEHVDDYYPCFVFEYTPKVNEA